MADPGAQIAALTRESLVCMQSVTGLGDVDAGLRLGASL